ncbi:MAG: VWA domain-containing protein [Acidobacteria bacterium]|nr:VWA domain-containing protein [Acidobacteriota bacterium]
MALVVCLMLSLGSALPSFSQDENPPERTFFEPIEVSVVNVEVLVTDTKGRPFPGLTSEDFEVFEDNRPMEITHFYAAPGVVPTGTGAPPVSLAAEADQDLYLTIVMVDSNLSPANRRSSLEALGALLPGLPGNSYVMLARSTDHLQILQPFTNDGDRLRTALEQLGEAGSTSLRTEEDRIRREMQTLAEQNPPSGHSALPDDRRMRPLEMRDFGSTSALTYVQHVKAFAAASMVQTEETLIQLRRLTRSLAGLHGRKVVLVLSDGIDGSPGANLFHEWERVFSYVANATSINPTIEAQKFDLSSSVSELAKNANADRVTFFAVTSPGRSSASSSGADREGGVTIGTSIDTKTQLEGIRADVLLARVTGGRVLENGRGLDREMNELAEEFASYYSLGYRPPHAGDGDYHRIRVEVDREKLELRHRAGYEDVGGASRIADRTLTAAILGLTENPLGVSLECRDQEPREDGLFLVPIVVRVPLSQLSLLPRSAEHEGRVSVIVAVRDAEGGLAEMERRIYPVKIPHDQFLSALQQNAEFILGLAMREGAQRVAVGVRDELGNVDSTLTVDLNVGEVKL